MLKICQTVRKVDCRRNWVLIKTIFGMCLRLGSQTLILSVKLTLSALQRFNFLIIFMIREDFRTCDILKALFFAISRNRSDFLLKVATSPRLDLDTVPGYDRHSPLVISLIKPDNLVVSGWNIEVGILYSKLHIFKKSK